VNFTSHFITQNPVNRLVSVKLGLPGKNVTDNHGLEMDSVGAIDLRRYTRQSVFNQFFKLTAVHNVRLKIQGIFNLDCQVLIPE